MELILIHANGSYKVFDESDSLRMVLSHIKYSDVQAIAMGALTITGTVEWERRFVQVVVVESEIKKEQQ